MKATRVGMAGPASRVSPHVLPEYFLHAHSSYVYGVAWAVSLNPTGGTYAATGGAGGVTILSASPSSFGEHRATFTSGGRPKFGMSVAHVRTHHSPATPLMMLTRAPESGRRKARNGE